MASELRQTCDLELNTTMTTQLAEACTKAAQCANLTLSDVRAAHKAACADGGPMELLLREAIVDAVNLAQRLEQLQGFAASGGPVR
jgi:hypothetical protein